MDGPGEFRVGIVAADYGATLGFYRDGLGLPVDQAWDRGDDDRGCVLRAGAGRIEVLPAAAGRPAAAAPVGLWLYLCVPDVDAAHARAVAHGLNATLPPTDEPWGHRRIRLADPDGLAVGLYQDVATPPRPDTP